MLLYDTNDSSWVAVPVLPEELRKRSLRRGLHGGVDEEFNTFVRPHLPLPFPRMRNVDQLKIEPIGLQTVIDANIGLHPITIHIAGIWLLGTKAAINHNLGDACPPERFDGPNAGLSIAIACGE